MGFKFIPGVLLDLGGFPGLLPGNGKVLVEVYEVSDEVLANLDALEGVEYGLYSREAIDDIQVYYYRGFNHDMPRQIPAPVIDSGDWALYLSMGRSQVVALGPAN